MVEAQREKSTMAYQDSLIRCHAHKHSRKFFLRQTLSVYCLTNGLFRMPPVVWCVFCATCLLAPAPVPRHDISTSVSNKISIFSPVVWVVIAYCPISCMTSVELM